MCVLQSTKRAVLPSLLLLYLCLFYFSFAQQIFPSYVNELRQRLHLNDHTGLKNGANLNDFSSEENKADIFQQDFAGDQNVSSLMLEVAKALRDNYDLEEEPPTTLKTQDSDESPEGDTTEPNEAPNSEGASALPKAVASTTMAPVSTTFSGELRGPEGGPPLPSADNLSTRSKSPAEINGNTTTPSTSSTTPINKTREPSSVGPPPPPKAPNNNGTTTSRPGLLAMNRSALNHLKKGVPYIPYTPYQPRLPQTYHRPPRPTVPTRPPYKRKRPAPPPSRSSSKIEEDPGILGMYKKLQTNTLSFFQKSLLPRNSQSSGDTAPVKREAVKRYSSSEEEGSVTTTTPKASAAGKSKGSSSSSEEDRASLKATKPAAQPHNQKQFLLKGWTIPESSEEKDENGAPEPEPGSVDPKLDPIPKGDDTKSPEKSVGSGDSDWESGLPSWAVMMMPKKGNTTALAPPLTATPAVKAGTTDKKDVQSTDASDSEEGDDVPKETTGASKMATSTPFSKITLPPAVLAPDLDMPSSSSEEVISHFRPMKPALKFALPTTTVKTPAKTSSLNESSSSSSSEEEKDKNLSDTNKIAKNTSSPASPGNGTGKSLFNQAFQDMFLPDKLNSDSEETAKQISNTFQTTGPPKTATNVTTSAPLQDVLVVGTTSQPKTTRRPTTTKRAVAWPFQVPTLPSTTTTSTRRSTTVATTKGGKSRNRGTTTTKRHKNGRKTTRATTAQPEKNEKGLWESSKAIEALKDTFFSQGNKLPGVEEEKGKKKEKKSRNKSKKGKNGGKIENAGEETSRGKKWENLIKSGMAEGNYSAVKGKSEVERRKGKLENRKGIAADAGADRYDPVEKMASSKWKVETGKTKSAAEGKSGISEKTGKGKPGEDSNSMSIMDMLNCYYKPHKCGIGNLSGKGQNA